MAMEHRQSVFGVPGPVPGDPEVHIGPERAAIARRTAISRRAMIGGGLAGLGGLMLFPTQLLAKEHAPDNAFVVLLKGVYQPVVRGPKLGLSAVDLDDGTYSTTKIYPVSGTPGHTDPGKAIGDFYVQFNGNLCAYHVAGGSFAMRFTGEQDVAFVDDGRANRDVRVPMTRAFGCSLDLE